MEQEVSNLANKQIQLAISNALNCLTQISALIFQNPSSNRSLRPNVSLRCRSSSNNRNDQKAPFHNTIPRYSIPATKNDLVHYQSRLLSYQQTNQTCCQTSQNINNNGSNRMFDVQYSFSLNKPWLTKINKQQDNLISIQNFVNEVIEHSIQTALLQLDYQNLTNNHRLSGDDETSCLLFDYCPFSAPIECLQAVNSYVDRFIYSTFEQAIETISSSEIEFFSNRLTEDIIADALSTITDDEIYLWKLKKKSIQLENIEQQQTNLFNQIPYYSSSIFHPLINNISSNEESIDSLVNNIAQQIYVNSFDELKQIFTKDNNKD